MVQFMQIWICVMIVTTISIGIVALIMFWANKWPTISRIILMLIGTAMISWIIYTVI